MIENFEELKHYLYLDRYVYGRKSNVPKLKRDFVWKFQLSLRMAEYHMQQKGIYHRIMQRFWGHFHYKYGMMLGFEIPCNVFGPGLKINHQGLIIINPCARIGAFCDIHQGVNIGMNGKSDKDSPTIGDNVWIGPGAKIFGPITIGDRCQIGANAVVNKSFPDEGKTIAGVPARIVSHNPNPYCRDINLLKKKYDS